MCRRKVRLRSTSTPSSLCARTTKMGEDERKKTLVVLHNQNIGTVIGKAVAKRFRNEVAELLFHRVHQSDSEGDIGSSGHSAQLVHVIGESFILEMQRTRKWVRE